MEKKRKPDIQSVLLIAAAVIIAALICYMCIEKSIDNKNVAAYEAKIVELQQTIGGLYQEIYLGTDDDSNEAEDTDTEEDKDFWLNAWSECRDELDSLYYTDEDIMDTMARILFKKGAENILATHISEFENYPEAEPRIETEIDGLTYVKRDVLYDDVVKEYSRIFTGNLLDEVLNKRFVEIDGYLYVSEGAGSGIDVAKIDVERISEADSEITYRVKYNTEGLNGDLSEDEFCSMTIKAVGNSYAISDTDFGKAE